jgi:hypothetical protein
VILTDRDLESWTTSWTTSRPLRTYWYLQLLAILTSCDCQGHSSSSTRYETASPDGREARQVLGYTHIAWGIQKA